MNRSRPGSPVAIPLLIGLSVLLLLISLASQTTLAQGPLSIVLGPVQRVLSNIGTSIGGVFRAVSSSAPTPGELLELREQNAALVAENVRLREFQAENVQYRQLLGFTQANPALSFVGADVVGIGNRSCDNDPDTPADIAICAQAIAGDPSPYARFVTINAGRSNGIETGMPVIGGGGVLIGRIGRVVNETTAQVQLLNDPGSFVNVQLQGSRATGTIAGQSDGTLRLVNVLQTESVEAGDLILTSGLGGALPPGLTVGQVDRVTSRDSETLKEASVRPGADLNRIEFVLVLKFKPPA
jgi:rod shape-determining protein MreC